ncbi:MAG TPA: nucleoside-diphosphate kinase [Propionibacteriaceae bacterium]|jgi:nucleoside-diphosphate kinase|nr:nucleoside-diphosphate kinase [Propionibacteriaceae bacterium]
MNYAAPPVPTQRSFVLIKPDAVRRGLAGAIISRFESKGLSIVAMELRQMTGELADQLYAEHVERPFYPPLRLFVTSGPSVAMIVEGDEAVDVVRTTNGATDGRKAAPGTIRGDFALSNRENLVHGSDSLESAEREIALWFPDLA